MVATEVKKIISKLRYNKIYSYDVFDAIENRNALYVAINRLVKDGVIARFSKGKFYKVKNVMTRFKGKCYKVKTGIDDKTIWKELVVPNRDVILGNALYNGKGLTTQNSFVYEVGTIGTKRGLYDKNGRKCKYFKIPVQPTQKNKPIIEFIEIIANKKRIMDLIEDEFLAYIKKNIQIFKQDKTKLKLLITVLKKYKKQMQVDFIKNIFSMDKSFANYILESTFAKYQQKEISR